MTAAFRDAGLQTVASEQRSALIAATVTSEVMLSLVATVTSEVMLSLGPGK